MNAQQKTTILAAAIDALRAESGVELELAGPGSAQDEFDCILKLKELHDFEYQAEVKAWAGHSNFGVLLAKLKRLGGRPLLVADYINPNLAGRLRDHGVEFVDTCGNAYLDVKGRLFVFSRGNRASEARPAYQLISRPEKAGNAMGRVLEPSGLRVVFAFLCDPSLVGKPYRDIAALAGVAVGTVGWVIRGLKEAGFLVDHGHQAERRLIRQEQLMERWVDNYPLKLQPKLHVGDFLAPTSGWWKRVSAGKYESHWGGEIAAAKLTKNLQPEVGSIYLPESELKTFVLDTRLRRYDQTKNGMKVQVYKQFWNVAALASGSSLPAKDVAPPLLVYADLVASGDPRNIENARMIYDRWLAGSDGKD